MIRVGIVGATGYTALELIRLLLRHPEVEITRLTSRDESSPHLGAVHESLRDRLDLRMTGFDAADFESSVDFAFSCLPHAASAKVVAQLVDRNIKVLDFSADYRLSNAALFEKIYDSSHPDAGRVGKVPYGIPELFREAIRESAVVANPGCFPSSVLMPLAPLMSENLVRATPIIADSKTGISGAGRKASLKFHYPECNESVAAYGVGTHRHMPEIDDIIARFAGVETSVVFTPHVVPMDRGILSTVYVQPPEGVTAGDCRESVSRRLLSFYANEPFIRIVDSSPLTKSVANTNFCDIHTAVNRDHVVILCALDNTIKGASGAAVQNFNLMNGFDETTALL